MGKGVWSQLDRRTPLDHTCLNRWSPREMFRKRETLLEVVRTGLCVHDTLVPRREALLNIDTQA